jgi:neurotransmitter:Na+ symporter, NSS family
MSEKRESIHGQWSGRWAFIMAAAGSAIGLGNIWKFPYITGENGGGAFVMVYLLCILLIGVPIMMAEVLLGRRGRRSPINTMRHLAQEEGRSHLWGVVGWIGVVAGFIILSYYSVIAGWALAYLFRSASGLFVEASPEFVAATFSGLTGDPERLLAWHSLFMALTLVVVARGVRSGLERAVRLMIPGLLVILLLLLGYALNSGSFARGMEFLFTPDFSRIDGKVVMVALGHAFFTLSLGMGAIMAYGSYLPQRTSIAGATLSIAALDTLVALLAGMVIFPIVFANGLEPGAGPGLIFQTLPIAFGQMPAGVIFATLFFVLLLFAAWSSAISLIEPAVAWLVENRGMSRPAAVTWIGGGAWLLGIVSILSFNLWSGSEYQWLGKTPFDLLDYLTSNIMLPLGGLLIALFVGWQMKQSSLEDELAMRYRWLFLLWYVVLRFVTPVAIVLVFLNLIGVVIA